jgi:surface-anchored protein
MLDAHDATASELNTINDRGTVGGNWSQASLANQAGFLANTAALQTTTPPGSSLLGVNQAGDTVGHAQSFGYVQTTAGLTVLTPPGATVAHARSINDEGLVVGDALGPAGAFAWTWKATSGYQVLPAEQATGVNNTGDIIGHSATGPWLFQSGTFQAYTLPQASSVRLRAINNRGQLLVAYRTPASGAQDRFGIQSESAFEEIALTLPTGFSQPSILGLNSSGEICGHARDSQGHHHGFRARPVSLPEITESHTDIAVRWQAGAFRLEVADTDYGASYPPEGVVLAAGPSARRLIPATASYRFLGPAGASTWLLPQAQDPSLPWLGLSSFVPGGVLQGNLAHLTLESISGPGHFQIFSVSGIGSPAVRINTADGIGPTDRVSLASGAHAHYNWAFSAPGLWKLRFRIRGNLAATGTEVASIPIELTFWLETGRIFPAALSSPKIVPSGQEMTIQGEVGRELLLRSSSDLHQWSTDQRLIISQPVTTLTAPAGGPRTFYQAIVR